MLWEKLILCAQKIRSSASDSFFANVIIGKRVPAREIGKRRIALHRSVLKELDHSRILEGISNFFQVLFSAPLTCYGAFFLLFGGLAFLLPILAGKSDSFDFLSFGILVSGIPLCFLHVRLIEAVRTSDLMRLFLFRYCEIPDCFFIGKKQNHAIWYFSFAGIITGAFSILFGTKWILLSLVFAALLPVAFAVPETLLPPIMLAFPFLGLFHHPSVILAVFASMALICRLPKILSGHRQDLFEKTDLFVLFFGGLLILDAVFSVSGVNRGGFLLCLYLLSAWFALRPALTVPKWRNRILVCFLSSGAVCSAIGIAQYFSGNGKMKWLDVGRFDFLGGRVCATFSNPNLLAVYLLAVFGISLGWVTKKGSARFLGWASLILSSLCLIFTWTRGAWLGALAATCLFLLFCSRSSLAAFLFLPISLPGLVLFLPAGVQSRFGSIGNLAETSSRYRLETWKGVLRLLLENPFGIGSGEAAFHLVYPSYAVSGTESVMHAHNVYLQIAVEHGMVGLFLLFAILFLLYRGFFAKRILYGNANDFTIFLGIAAALIGLLTMGLFDHLWYQPSLFYLFGFLLSGISAYSLCEGENQYET